MRIRDDRMATRSIGKVRQAKESSFIVRGHAKRTFRELDKREFERCKDEELIQEATYQLKEPTEVA